MKTETQCPACKHPVTMGTIMGASTPYRIKCKNCKSRLRAGTGATPVLVVILTIACFIGFILGFGPIYQYLEGKIAMMDIMVILLIVVVPFLIISEVILSLFVVNKSGLVVHR